MAIQTRLYFVPLLDTAVGNFSRHKRNSEQPKTKRKQKQ